MASLVSLHAEVARIHHAELLRNAEVARFAAGARPKRRSGLLSGRFRRRHAEAGSSASPLRTYTVAPTER